MRRLLLLVGLLLSPTLGASDGHAPSAAPEHPPGEHAAEFPAGATPEEIESMLRIGQRKLEAADYSSAEIAFRTVLNSRVPRATKLQAATQLARTYRKANELTKAIAVYEKVIKEYPEDPSLPTLFLELGRSQRALGAYKQAISRFYNVINSTLKLPDNNPELYRQLARTAQFEIAETYFLAGDYAQANRFYSRLKLLDLTPEDRAIAHFKSADSLFRAGDYEGTVTSLRSFLELYPEDKLRAEAMSRLSTSLQVLGRTSEALATALEILRAEQARSTEDAQRWAYWQRRTGNDLANAFYERGDFNSALVIYESLVKISEDPLWKIPVSYQIGLCHERLQMFDRARDAYQSIIDTAKSPTSDIKQRTEVSDLAEMAAWRLQQMSWYQETQKQVSQLFPRLPSETIPPTSPAPVTHHDAQGSADPTSPPVR